jgi:hypothetical protein
MALPGMITAIALIEYMFFTLQVGMKRAELGVEAPAISGNEVWERYFRVQQNTLEQLVIFLPSLWLFAHFWSPTIAAGVGLLFVIGRPLYFAAYVRSPSSRTTGFLLGFLSNVVLVLGCLAGAIRALL